jgi:hypothetical protein
VRSIGRLGVGFIALSGISCSAEIEPAEASFDRLELVVRFDMVPGGGPEAYAATDDGSSSWVEARKTPDRGAGIFRAEGRIQVRVPEDEPGQLEIEALSMRLVPDDYTRSGWLRGARLAFTGRGRAELLEQRDATTSFWRVVQMPRLALTDANRSVRSDFDWISEAPTEALVPEVWLYVGGQSRALLPAAGRPKPDGLPIPWLPSFPSTTSC